MLMLKIAFRNVFRQKRRSILTMLTMFGGFTLASISIGWSDGSYSRIIDMFTRNRLGHIQLHGRGYLDKPSIYNTINDYEKIENSVRNVKYVESSAPRVFAAGLASKGGKTVGIEIRGIDPEKENAATSFNKKIVEGDLTLGELKLPFSRKTVLGKGLARLLNAKVGDEVVVLSQAADGSIANDLYTVAGISDSSDEVGDRAALYLSLNDAQELLALEGRVHEIAVIIKDINDIDKAVAAIKNSIGRARLSVEPWQVFSSEFYKAMKADREGMWISIFVIILIVSVGVLNTVLMAVLERQREYGLLKALGTKPFQIIKLIIIETNILATFSIIIGALLSILANYLLSIYGISFPEPLTYGGITFNEFYSKITPLSLYLPALTVYFSATLISILPGIKAATVNPATAMRGH